MQTCSLYNLGSW